MWGQRGTWGSKKFATAKQGVYPKGDTFRGILELQLGAVVLKVMVFGRLKKEMGRREPYLFDAVLKFLGIVPKFSSGA